MKTLLFSILFVYQVVAVERFYVPNKRANWFEAQESCTRLNCTFATLSTRADHDALVSFFQTADKYTGIELDTYWIGLSDLAEEGSFSWASNARQATFTNWAEGQPDDAKNYQDCAAIVGQNINTWHWYDEDCWREIFFVCEAVADRCIQPL